VVLFLPVRSVALVGIALSLGAAVTLAACATVDSPRRTSDSPSVRCVNEPGRGGSLDANRPLFFLFCAQSP
jgi:hypothetical protein